ncbi:ATP-binding cassette domain-containing protein [Labrys sp. KNU-23]|uniref:methionine ABC transporter ATP-binding protein n=1 Tax=Labrys sp. KNU-23 TaxID=2789216 RepID=UPI0011EF7C65|nr:ATP-binding cassette domain-containing protein [Labrys sp. KNU-23]QEN85139.1 ATP-binding cassette domain-containing protein [Labrys sp. KNU-23]
MIRIEKLRKVYRQGSREFVALDDVTLDIPKGAVFGVLGRSGAGKSTLIRCLNLLERPTVGRIIVGGHDLTALPPSELRRQRRRIGTIFQHFHLLHSRNVADNVAVPLEILGIRREARRRRVEELLELVGLADKARAFPSQLSGGQKQRVGIARALAAEPDVLLSDEATSALDTETTGSILNLLRDVNARLGVTIVLITHELGVVKAICDSAALLNAGRVVEAGPLTTLVADPTSLLGRALLPDCALTDRSDEAIAELTFIDAVEASPVLSTLAQQHSIGVTLLGGGVETIAGQRVGRLRVGFRRPEGGLDLAGVLDFLNDRGVRAELI